MTVEPDRREHERLLGHLGGAGCYAIASPLGCGRIALYRDVGFVEMGVRKGYYRNGADAYTMRREAVS